MVNFFSRRRAPEYNGFAKYSEEYKRHSLNQPSEQVKRAQSLTSASQAAAAALQRHGQAPAANTQRKPPQRQPARANSLSYGNSGGYNRSNSLQSYTYTPKASYATGPDVQRSYSLRSNSLTGSIRGGRRPQAPPVQSSFPEEPEFDEHGEEGDVTITTKTTKVVDSYGRTRSITTETIRTLPDGSNIIETKTTNISRSGSRANSFQGAPSGQQQTNYNLRKIEEDLQDFEYTYLDQSPTRQPQPPHPQSYESPQYQPPQLNSPQMQSPQIHSPQMQSPQLQSSQLHTFQAPPQPQQPVQYQPQPQAQIPPSQIQQSQIPEVQIPQSQQEPVTSPQKSTSPAKLGLPDSANDYRANSMASTQSNKRLKSILKNTASSQNLLPEATPSPQKRTEEKRSTMAQVRDEHSLSPPRLAPAPNLKPSQASVSSGANSIKFSETVETIPHDGHSSYNFDEIERNDELRKQQELKNNVNLYNKAMEVAMKKVYGDADVPASPQSPESPQHVPPRLTELKEFTEKKSEKKLKNDEQLAKTEAAGLPKNYVYENHHKDFKIHSMRASGGESSSSRKERAKEEKKQKKLEQKRYEEALKAEEKQKKKANKKEWSFSPFKSHRKQSSKDVPISEPVEAHAIKPETQAPAIVATETPKSRKDERKNSLQRHVSASSREDEDEFVDVPEFADGYVDADAQEGPSTIPDIARGAEIPTDVYGAPVDIERGAPRNGPALSGTGEPVIAPPIAKETDLDEFAEPNSDFPTLIGGADGTPVVITSSTGDLTTVNAPLESFAQPASAGEGKSDTSGPNEPAAALEQAELHGNSGGPTVSGKPISKPIAGQPIPGEPIPEPVSESDAGSGGPTVSGKPISKPIDAQPIPGQPVSESIPKPESEPISEPVSASGSEPVHVAGELNTVYGNGETVSRESKFQDVPAEALISNDKPHGLPEGVSSGNDSSALNIETPQTSQLAQGGKNEAGDVYVEKSEKKKKKTNKFKRAVEKYFLTAYSR